MTLEEIDIACKGYQVRMGRTREVERLIAGILINVNRKPNTPAVRLEDVYPLYTDNKQAVKLMSKEEYEEFDEMMKKVQWQKN